MKWFVPTKIDEIYESVKEIGEVKDPQLNVPVIGYFWNPLTETGHYNVTVLHDFARGMRWTAMNKTGFAPLMWAELTTPATIEQIGRLNHV